MNKMAKFKACGEVNTTISGKLLYLVLMDITDDNNEVVIPQRKVSEALQISKGTVSRNLRKLRDAGFIDVVPRLHPEGGRAANKYVLK